MDRRGLDRHARQIRLTDVGPQGQARVAAATVELRLVGLEAAVAVRYLAGSGFGGLRVRDERLAGLARAVDPSVGTQVDSTLADEQGPRAYDLRDPAARAVATGARAALHALRSVLAGDRS
jgi:molybdopterin/thiamine biosynthesis adenylyltransferase